MCHGNAKTSGCSHEDSKDACGVTGIATIRDWSRVGLFVSGVLINLVSLSRLTFICRFSDRQPSGFSLLGQRKPTKRKATRIPPISCALRKPSMVFALRASLSAVQICSRQICRFWRGFSEGLSLALRKRAAFLPLPYRAILAKSCDARGGITGIKPSRHLSENHTN